MISHLNCISAVLSFNSYQSFARNAGRDEGKERLDVALGILPVSHIYGLVICCMCTAYRGDELIVLPAFHLKSLLAAIEQ